MAQSLAVLCVLSADITGSSRDAYVYEDQFYVEVKIVDLISQGFFFTQHLQIKSDTFVSNSKKFALEDMH